MCQRVQCEKCGRPTWAGCGAHIEQVLGDVPPEERCQCPMIEEIEEEYSPPVEAPAPKSWLRRLLGS